MMYHYTNKQMIYVIGKLLENSWGITKVKGHSKILKCSSQVLKAISYASPSHIESNSGPH